MKAARGWCKVAAAVGFLLAGAVAEADGPTLTPVAQHDISNNFNPEFHEASGLGLAKNGTKLWSVGDQDNFSMYKMELSGAAVSNATAGPASGVTSIQDASFEGVTYAPPPSGVTDDHYIYLVDEAANSIVPVNYNTNQYSAAVFLSGMAGYSSVVCQGGTQTVAAAFTNAGNSGLEGITWNNDVSSFFVLKEKDPGLLIQVSANLGTITACQVLSYNGADYSGISYDSGRKQYWIVSDDDKSLALYDWTSAKPVKQWGLGYDSGEGVAYDPGTSQIFIVTDNGGSKDSLLYVYKVQ